MTVAELVKQLQGLDQSLDVFVWVEQGSIAEVDSIKIYQSTGGTAPIVVIESSMDME